MPLPRQLFASFIFAALLFAVSAVAQPARAQVQVAVIGDSNVYGKGVSSPDNYPSQLAAALKARGLDVSVSNGGINGDTSAGLAARLESAVPAGTKVAVIWIGINDARRGVPLAQIKANIAGIVARLRARGIESYVIRPPVYDIADHKNPALIIQGDGHFNRAGYSKMIGKTIGPIQALVVKAAKKKAA